MNIIKTLWHRLTRPYRTRQKRRLEAVLQAHGIRRKAASQITNHYFSATMKDHHVN